MDQLRDPSAPNGLEVLVNAAVRGLGHKHMPVEPEPAKGRGVKVVPMHVREVNEIRVERLNEAIWNGWVIPPGAPVGGADQPGVTQELPAAARNLETCVT